MKVLQESFRPSLVWTGLRCSEENRVPKLGESYRASDGSIGRAGVGYQGGPAWILVRTSEEVEVAEPPKPQPKPEVPEWIVGVLRDWHSLWPDEELPPATWELAARIAKHAPKPGEERAKAFEAAAKHSTCPVPNCKTCRERSDWCRTKAEEARRG